MTESLQGSEFGNISGLVKDFSVAYLPGLNQESPENDPRILGLHVENNGTLRASYFVGQVWLEMINKEKPENRKVPLMICPKEDLKVNYLKMIHHCFQNNIVCRHMENSFYFWPDEKPMETQINIDCVRILIISMYLQALVELCKRHLRKDFIRVQKNLTSKIKGRILIKDNLLSNTLHGRPDRIFCQYQRHDLDNKENQILMAALHQCQKELRRNTNLTNISHLQEWARISNSALSGVTLRRINPSEFQALQLGGMKKVYKKPLQLAKWILKLLGTDPNQAPCDSHQQTKIPPFAIDMNKLFERYCEVKLRNSNKFNKIWAGYQNNNLGEFGIRPDFIAECKDSYEIVVLDAKYKYDWIKKLRGEYRYDIYQIVSYCRHNKSTFYANMCYPNKSVIMSPLDNNERNKNIKTSFLGNNILTNDFTDPKIYHYLIALP